eukprot:13090132-Alexandrium_andersonii.AAC.1
MSASLVGSEMCIRDRFRAVSCTPHHLGHPKQCHLRGCFGLECDRNCSNLLAAALGAVADLQLSRRSRLKVAGGWEPLTQPR